MSVTDPNASAPASRADRPSRRPVSRRVRLHRTIAVVVVALLVAVAAGIVFSGSGSQPDTPTSAVLTTPRSTSTPAASPPGTSGTTVPSQTGVSSSPVTSTRQSPTSTPTTAGPDDDADGSEGPEPASADPATVVEKGTGKLRVVAVPGPPSTASGRTVRYTVEIEDGLGVDATAVATTIRSILLDPQGWQTQDKVRFVNVSPAQAAAGAQVDIRITLASPATTDKLCAPLRTLSQVSCWNAARQRSVLNSRRWLLGIPAYDSVDRYRVYQVNHEVGHGLNHRHEYCSRKGAYAPVMQQQTLGMQGCRPWPYPTRP